MHPAFFETNDPRFCTFLQAKEQGWTIKAGSKSVPVIFYKPLEVEEREKAKHGDDDAPATRLIHMLKAYSVFHVGTQVEGAPPFDPPKPEDLKWDHIDAPYIMLKNMGIRIIEGGERAAYSPERDIVIQPPHAAFESPEKEAFTILHEGFHGTAHPSRMNRDLSGTFGSIKYATEEVLVDTTSALSGRVIGLSPDLDNHAAYIRHWAKHARADKKEVMRLAREAQKVCDYGLSHIPGMELEVEQKPAQPPSTPSCPASSLPQPAAQPGHSA